MTSTRSRLRKDLTSVSSSSVTTSTVGVLCPSRRGRPAAVFVDGCRTSARRATPSVPACAWSESALRSAARAPSCSPSRRSCAGSAGTRRRRRRTAARGSCPGGRGRCPSGATASRGRRRRARGSSPRACPARCAFSSARTASCTRCGFELDAEDGLVERDLLLGAAEHRCLGSGH